MFFECIIFITGLCQFSQICFENKCQDLKVYGVSEDCSRKCSGRGVSLLMHDRRCVMIKRNVLIEFNIILCVLIGL